jgi:hypothetical protein
MIIHKRLTETEARQFLVLLKKVEEALNQAFIDTTAAVVSGSDDH